MKWILFWKPHALSTLLWCITELEESIGDASASLHTFFINLINKSAGSAVHRDKQPADSSMVNTIEENLEYCLNRDLIPYFVKKKYNELIIKPDIMNEIIRSGVKILWISYKLLIY